MRPHLLYRERDLDLERGLPGHADALTQDLGIDILLHAMAGDDPFVLDIVRKVVLSAVVGDVDTIRYRQAILVDAMRAPDIPRALYGVVVEALEARRQHWFFGLPSTYPSSTLSSAVELLQLSVGFLRKLRAMADAERHRVASEGLGNLFAMLQAELSDAYFAEVEQHLRELQFRDGVLISARLGPGNAGTDFVLHRPHGTTWWRRMLGKGPPGLTFWLDERDQAGARALGELRDRGINVVANAVAQAAAHVESFFTLLRAELAFYVGCLNLRDRLTAIGAPVCIPDPVPAEQHTYHFAELYDPSLALNAGRPPVGNALDAGRVSLVMMTGANQGGKSTLLRALGLAQLMMHAGLFVAAQTFTADVSRGTFTHFRREEDVTMKRGKLDEELHRMSELADTLAPGALVLFNESFASTNEREGSEIARQVVAALLERRIKVVFVTHLYDCARSMFERGLDGAVYLRAERGRDGERTFKLLPGEPLTTSFGADLYRAVFGDT
jgi:MutS-like protein